MISQDYLFIYESLIGRVVCFITDMTTHYYIGAVEISSSDVFSMQLCTFGAGSVYIGHEGLTMLFYLDDSDYVSCANEWSEAKSATVKFTNGIKSASGFNFLLQKSYKLKEKCSYDKDKA